MPDRSIALNEPSPVVTAVVAALAGVRTHNAVAVLGTATVLRQALEAGTGRPLVDEGPVDVVIAINAPDIATAVSMLRPGGRLVAIAADSGSVVRTAALHGLEVRHAEPVDGRVAWSGSSPT